MSNKPSHVIKFKPEGKDFSIKIGVAWPVGDGHRLDIEALPMKPGAIFMFPNDEKTEKETPK